MESVKLAAEKMQLARDFVEQMARQIKPQGRLFLHELFAHAPRCGLYQIGFLGTGDVAVFPCHIEQAALVLIGQCSSCEVEGAVDRCTERSAVALQRNEGAGLDECVDGALVDAGAVDAQAEIEQA